MQDKIHGKYDVLGRRIKAARMAAGLTQLQLAEKINIAYSSVFRWEHGESKPRISSLRALARVCAVPIGGLTSAIKEKTKIARNRDELIKAEIAKRLRSLRGNMLQRDYAKKIGMTPSVYLRYERGERRLRDFQIRNICVICGVSANWLLFGKERVT
jgi:transcriptional regulator with XRE-family HTH domain